MVFIHLSFAGFKIESIIAGFIWYICKEININAEQTRQPKNSLYADHQADLPPRSYVQCRGLLSSAPLFPQLRGR